ncbi:hypothetical protein B296_00014604 [Ensete ventricosum]|uniref:Uncharacterized protein n=1 Tax=Ensete ventricosum TaxID=4639 RepID=A0A427B270_ENSVE|nr:hypothetical protein B296_00014604 [Ensete ventricosum]
MPGILNIHVYVQTNIIFFQVIKFASPSSAGAESIDPDCSWVEQWYCLVIFFYELFYWGSLHTRFFELYKCPSPLQLSRQVVQNINLTGGSFLGVSRGGPSTSDMVDNIQHHLRTVVLICDFWTTQAKRIDMLFVLGGDGTHAGALAIHNEVLHNSISVN